MEEVDAGIKKGVNSRELWLRWGEINKNMAEGKKAFVLYCDIIHTVQKKLTNEQAGCLFKHTLRYVKRPKIPEPNDLLTTLS